MEKRNTCLKDLRSVCGETREFCEATVRFYLVLNANLQFLGLMQVQCPQILVRLPCCESPIRAQSDRETGGKRIITHGESAFLRASSFTWAVQHLLLPNTLLNFVTRYSLQQCGKPTCMGRKHGTLRHNPKGDASSRPPILEPPPKK